MCGIIGLYTHKSIDKYLFSRSLELINHRGPDQNNLIFIDNMAMGFQRLAIQDLSNAAMQPMSDADLNYWLLFNGEIYNYIEIKQELDYEGITFNSTSDTEVLLSL